MPVNPYIAAPRPPGPWVDEWECICGEEYRNHRCWIHFSEACTQFRVAARNQGIRGGGFRSRRAILWMMRVIKLADWYEEHHGCQYFND